MNYKLPILTAAVAIGAVAAWLGQAGWEWALVPDGHSGHAAAIGSDAIEAGATAGNLPRHVAKPDLLGRNTPENAGEVAGAEALYLAWRTLLTRPRAGADLRARVTLVGHSLAATGVYWQLGGAAKQLSRLELRASIDGKAAVMRSVNDGRFVWIFRDLPGEDRDFMGRIDVNRVETRSDKPASDRPSAGSSAAHVGLIAGLPRLLALIGSDFDLSTARPVRFRGQDAWRIDGALSEGALGDYASRLREDGESPGELQTLSSPPPPGPAAVTVVLSTDDWFPRIIAFWAPTALAPSDGLLRTVSADNSAFSAEELLRRLAAPGEEQAPDGDIQDAFDEAFAVFEFHNVRFDPPLDPLQFSFTPGDGDVIDLTDRYREALTRQHEWQKERAHVAERWTGRNPRF